MSTNNGYPTTAMAANPPTNTQYINLSDYMYEAFNTAYKKTPLAADIGYTPLLQRSLLHPLGSPVVSVDNATGLYAEAFVSTNKTGPKNIVIAYEGTKLSGAISQDLGIFSANEIKDDVQLFNGQEADSLPGAASFAQRVIAFAGKLGIGTQNIYVTGHSLGAAEADYAASQTGLAGVTFAAPGISTTYTGVYPNVPNAGTVTNYVDAGDPIGNYAADGNDTLQSVLTSNSIKHYGGVTVLPNVKGQLGLTLAAAGYAAAKDLNSTTGEVAALAGAIYTNGKYHLLPQYASDLGTTVNGVTTPLPLYLSAGSTNSGSTSTDTSQLSVDASYIAAALTGGGMPQTSSASSSTGNASVLAASSATSAQAMGVKSHAG